MAQMVGDSRTCRRRERGAPDRLPDVGHEVLRDPAEGSDGDRGRLRRRRDHHATKAEAGTGFNAVPFPSIKPGANSTAVEIGGDMVVTFRDKPAIEAFVKYLATAAGGDDLGEERRLRHRQQERVAQRVPGRRSPGDGGADREGEVGRVRHVGPAAGGVRRHDRTGRVGDLPGLPEEPEERRRIQKQLETAAAAAYKKREVS